MICTNIYASLAGFFNQNSVYAVGFSGMGWADIIGPSPITAVDQIFVLT
jgi:hypothetical protein